MGFSVSFLDVSQGYANANSYEDAFVQTCEFAKMIGFEYMIYAPLRNHKQARMVWKATTYPSEWQRMYQEKGYVLTNPIRQYSLRSKDPFTWSELERLFPEKCGALFSDCRDTGLQDAIVIPAHGPYGQSIAIGFATQCSNFDEEPWFRDYLKLLAFKLFHSFDTPPETEIFRLTKREHQILHLVCEGFNNRDISDKLSISDNSVEWHLKNLFSKMAVTNRTSAVIKALEFGLIAP